MKRFSSLSLVLMITLIISACGARGTQTTPTVDLVAMQSTMAAAALTMVAETQAAIPTTTPLPPTATITNIPPPTNTFLPLPPLGATFTPVPGSADACVNQVLPASLQGKTVKMRINNSTKATLSVTVYLNQTQAQGQCGYRSYTLAPQQSVVINDLVEGCYTLWAWNPDPKDYFMVTNGTNCVDSSDTWVFDASTRSIELR